MKNELKSGRARIGKGTAAACGANHGKTKGPIPGPTDPLPIERGLSLDFMTDTDGDYLPARLDGKALGTLELPMTGFSSGDDIYVFFALDSGSVISVSHDEGRTYSTVASLPSKKLRNVFPVVLDSAQVPNLPATWESARTVLVFGRHTLKTKTSTTYGGTYVAAAPMAHFADTTTWRYFSGRTDSGPTWDTSDANAQPLYSGVESSECNGGFSVTWLPNLNRWMTLNRCDGPKAILYRVAADLFGPWSEERVFFDRSRDGGLCHFMHQDCNAPGSCCDTNYSTEYETPDGGRVWGASQTGYPYAPYVIEPFTRWDSDREALTLYFLMSVWNPYSPMVMKAVITADQIQ